MSTKIEVRPLQPFGAMLDGFDYPGLTPELQEQLKRLIAKHHLLVFRGNELSTDDQITLLRSFGTPLDEKGKGSLSFNVTNTISDFDFPVLGNTPEQSARGIRYPFHADYEWTKFPHPYISLYALACEGGSSPTLFANLAEGLRRVPESLRHRIANLRAVHAYDFSPEYNDDRRIRLVDVKDEAPLSVFPRTAWPMVITHPGTGEQLLYVSECMASHVESMGDEESEALLQELFGILYAEDKIYVHHWAQNDLVIWDNIALQHSRRDTPDTSRRTLRRVAISTRSSMSEVVDSATGERSDEFQIPREMLGLHHTAPPHTMS